MTPVAMDVCARLEARVLARAPGQTLAGLRRSCARAVHRIQPDGALARARAARRRREVWITPEADGTAILSARLDLATAIACERRIHDAADQLRAHAADDGHPVHDGSTAGGSGATRAGEWRADAVAALLLHGRVDGLPDPEVHVELVIDLPTLLDLADHPAELPGHGPIPAQMARELIASAGSVWVRRLVTDPVTGHLLDYGRTRYRLPEGLTRYVTARDRHCRFPCCDHRSEAHDIDHRPRDTVDAGGTTSAANTGPLHRRHHRLKTHHGWSITPLHPDGSVTVNSPHGLTHHRPPSPQLEGSLPDPDPPPF